MALFSLSSEGGRGTDHFWASFIRTLEKAMATHSSTLDWKITNAIHEGSTPKTNHPNQRFHFKELTLWVRISPYGFGEEEHKYSDHNISSAQFSHSVVSDSLQPHGLQHTRLPCPSPTPGACSNSCHFTDAIQPAHPLSSPSPPAFNLSQHQGLSQAVCSSYHMAKVLEFQLQHQSLQ